MTTKRMPAPPPPSPTSYVILERINATGATAPPLTDHLDLTQAWCEVGTVVARDKDKAVDVWADEHDADEHGNLAHEARLGAFKAVAVSAWKGGKIKVQEQMTVTKPLEET
jgi:hypothetical protein